MFDAELAVGRLREAESRLLVTVGGLGDPAAPSSLPGWSVGHLLTHIARNADSAHRRLAGAARGEVVDQYPGGAEGRAAEIDAGAGRAIDDLVDDVRVSGEAVVELASSMSDGVWDRPTRSVSGTIESAEAVLVGRIREVEVHHVDLGAGYTASDWPTWFVTDLLDRELPALRERIDPAHLLAWVMGRGPAPDLDSWR